MRNKIKYIVIVSLFTMHSVAGSAQFKAGITDFSVYATNLQWGIPFLQVTPVHPGLELGFTFLENEKESITQRIGASAAYFYHDLIAQGVNAGIYYQFHYKIGDVIGFDAGAGTGFCYAFYAGDGYSYNEETSSWEKGVYDKLFFQAHLGFGLSYIGNEKIQPYIGYDLRMLQSVYNLVSNLKLGVRINL